MNEKFVVEAKKKEDKTSMKMIIIIQEAGTTIFLLVGRKTSFTKEKPCKPFVWGRCICEEFQFDEHF